MKNRKIELTIEDYIKNLNARFKTGISTEHSYRGDLQNLLESLAGDVLVTNEPARVACGAPDYILTKGNIPVGYIEAKDIGADLSSKAFKEQFARYRKSLGNLIITDYLEFQLFREGESADSVSIGKIHENRIIGISNNYKKFNNLIEAFCTYAGQTVKSASELSKMMAGKARLLAGVIEKALVPGGDENKNDEQNSTLHDQFTSFQQILIPDISEKEFADSYAQTIAYGMFAARLHDHTLADFSRRKAAELIPKSNPFLRKLFQYIAGYDLDDRIRWIVDALADLFRAADVADLMRDFGKSAQKNDPIIHFYETFLSEYDPVLRKSRGVWYTPEPVVKFIVRAVDDILKTEFGLSQGLADTSKTKIKVDVQGKKAEQEVHKVQILDPAAGTGTFLAEVVKHIYRQFEGQQGIWSSYAEEHLIPRLNGFEVLMASYAMAHLKLDLLLSETGFKPKKPQRFRVFLTNSLEEHHPDTGSLFAAWLSTEANEANYIKRNTPVMVVLGNPPYAVSSSNKGKWIQNLIADYKKNLDEKKLNLDDDYIKFIRYGEYLIDKNGEGVLAFVSNNSFIDGLTHRQMRKHLLETFDKIYILDLHGNAKKKETAPDGSRDENVFDIMQGVSVNLLVKNNSKKKNESGQVFHFDLWGKREKKHEFLSACPQKPEWKKLDCKKPCFFFVPKNFALQNRYEKGFATDRLFDLYCSGVQTDRDLLFIDIDESVLSERIKLLLSKNYDREFEKKYNVRNSSGYNLLQRMAKSKYSHSKIRDITYRPFDVRKIYYDEKLVSRAGYESNRHLLKPNLGLIVKRGFDHNNSAPCFISRFISDRRGWTRPGMQGAESVFPLYFYPEAADMADTEQKAMRKPNLNKEIVQKMADNLVLQFTNEKEPFGSAQDRQDTFAPIDILDYIYAVLHSPSYREKYKEFLKIDFPRVPYPKDAKTFWQLAKLGGELRQLHLLESTVPEKRTAAYPQPGENIVEKIRFENSRVWINKQQYFDKVPQSAWEFWIGGYQPAQKWLKDRKGRKLNFDDIVHYQKIITTLSETDRIMKKTDRIDVFGT